MSILANILSGGASKLIDSVKDAVDEFHLSGEEKQAFKLKMEQLLQDRDSEVEETIRTELNAQMTIIKAELEQGDNFTKRARPTVVYVGLFAIVFNYCLVPSLQSLFGVEIQAFALPTEFWMAWGGIVGTYAVGRSLEKRGVRNRWTGLATGSDNREQLLNL